MRRKDRDEFTRANLRQEMILSETWRTVHQLKLRPDPMGFWAVDWINLMMGGQGGFSNEKILN
jgi:hypothetical protein